MAIPRDLRVESLADHPQLIEQAGLLRWQEWAYGADDPTPFIEVTAREAGQSGQLPITIVAIDAAGEAAGVVRLGPVDDELSAAERGGRTPWQPKRDARRASLDVGLWRPAASYSEAAGLHRQLASVR
jgi:hypothetical protein